VTKLSKSCIVSLMILSSGCNEIPLPTIERCTVLSNGAICTDERMPVDEYVVPQKYLLAYQCTNPEDYQAYLLNTELGKDCGCEVDCC